MTFGVANVAVLVLVQTVVLRVVRPAAHRAHLGCRGRRLEPGAGRFRTAAALFAAHLAVAPRVVGGRGQLPAGRRRRDLAAAAHVHRRLGRAHRFLGGRDLRQIRERGPRAGRVLLEQPVLDRAAVHAHHEQVADGGQQQLRGEVAAGGQMLDARAPRDHRLLRTLPGPVERVSGREVRLDRPVVLAQQAQKRVIRLRARRVGRAQAAQHPVHVVADGRQQHGALLRVAPDRVGREEVGQPRLERRHLVHAAAVRFERLRMSLRPGRLLPAAAAAACGRSLDRGARAAAGRFLLVVHFQKPTLKRSFLDIIILLR